MVLNVINNSSNIQGGERVGQSYSPRAEISIYYRDSFMGREAGKIQNEMYNGMLLEGLTEWVASHFEVLDVGDAPYSNNREINSLTRALWQAKSEEFLGRIFPPRSERFIIRKLPQSSRDEDVFLLFPHPEEGFLRRPVALEMNFQN